MPISQYLPIVDYVQLMRQSLGVLMEGTPEGLNPAQVEAALRDLPCVAAVHDLHIWSLSVGKPSLSVHILVDDDKNRRVVLEAAARILSVDYGIDHATIQVEEAVDDIYCNLSSAAFAARSPHLVPAHPQPSPSSTSVSLTAFSSSHHAPLRVSPACDYGTLI